MSLYRLADSPYWWVNVKDPHTGKRVRKSTGLTEQDLAQKVMEQLKAALLLQRPHPLLYQPVQQVTEPSWEEAANRFLDETRHKADHHNDNSKAAYILTHWRGKKLKDIQQPQVNALVNQLRGKGTSGATINRYLSFIKAVLNRAWKQWEWLEKVPHITKQKEAKSRIRFLTKEEAQKLLAALPPHLRDMALFTLCTGLRASNVTGLEWQQVDLSNQHLWIEPDQAKSRKAIAVPLNAEAVHTGAKGATR